MKIRVDYDGISNSVKKKKSLRRLVYFGFCVHWNWWARLMSCHSKFRSGIIIRYLKYFWLGGGIIIERGIMPHSSVVTLKKKKNAKIWSILKQVICKTQCHSILTGKLVLAFSTKTMFCTFWPIWLKNFVDLMKCHINAIFEFLRKLALRYSYYFPNVSAICWIWQGPWNHTTNIFFVFFIASYTLTILHLFLHYFSVSFYSWFLYRQKLNWTITYSWTLYLQKIPSMVNIQMESIYWR